MEVGWHANIWVLQCSFLVYDNPLCLGAGAERGGRDGVRATRYINMNGKLYWKILFLSCFRCGQADFIRLMVVRSVAWSSCQMHQFSTVEMNSHSLTHSIYLPKFVPVVYEVSPLRTECVSTQKMCAIFQMLLHLYLSA